MRLTESQMAGGRDSVASWVRSVVRVVPVMTRKA